MIHKYLPCCHSDRATGLGISALRCLHWTVANSCCIGVAEGKICLLDTVRRQSFRICTHFSQDRDIALLSCVIGMLVLPFRAMWMYHTADTNLSQQLRLLQSWGYQKHLGPTRSMLRSCLTRLSLKAPAGMASVTLSMRCREDRIDARADQVGLFKTSVSIPAAASSSRWQWCNLGIEATGSDVCSWVCHARYRYYLVRYSQTRFLIWFIFLGLFPGTSSDQWCCVELSSRKCDKAVFLVQCGLSRATACTCPLKVILRF